MENGKFKSIWNNGIIWSSVAVLVNSAMNFLIIPAISRQLGIEAYGYILLSNTMITYIDVISLAINSFASRYIALKYHSMDLKQASEFYSTVFLANLVLSLSLLVFTVIFVLNINIFLVVSDIYVSEVKLLFLIVFIRYAFVLMRSVFEVPAFIVNKIYLTERIRTYSYFIQSVLLIILCVIIPAKIYYVGLASAIASFFMFFSEVRIAHRIVPDLKIKLQDFSSDKLKQVMSSGIWNSINNLGNLLNSGLDLIITNKLLSEAALGMISVSKTFGSMCYILANAVGNSLKPKQLQFYSHNDIRGLIVHLKKSMKLTGTICTIIIVGFICCGKEFLDLWIPGQDTDTIYILSVIVLFGDIITGVVNPLFYAFTLTNSIKLPCMITITLGIFNVLSMYLLIKFTKIGIYAVVATTVFLNLVHFLDTPIYASYCLMIPCLTFYPTILIHLFNFFFNTVFMCLVNHIYPAADNWIELIIKVIVFVVCISTMSFAIIPDKEEKRALLKKLCSR